MSLLVSKDCGLGLWGNKKNLCLLLASFLCCANRHGFDTPPVLEPSPTFHMTYGGFRLEPSQDSESETIPPEHANEQRLDRAAKPQFSFYEGRFCFFSQGAFFFDAEAGLRVWACAPEPKAMENATKAGQLTTTFARGASVSSGPISVTILSVAELRSWERPVASIDGAASSRMTLLATLGLQGQTAWEQGKPLTNAQYQRVLSRRFSVDSYHVLVYADRVVFLYQSSLNSNWLAVSVQGTEYASQFLAGLGAVPDIHQRLFAKADNVPAVVSEIFFPEQGPAPFTELAGPSDRDAWVHYSITDDEGTHDVAAFLFRASVLVIPTRSATTATSESVVYQQLRANGASDRRSFSRDSSQSLLPSWLCLADAPCGSPGVHPVLVRPAESDPAAFCSLDDFDASEINPFGLKSDGRFDSGGKFVEIRLRRSCRGGRVFFWAGAADLDPGWSSRDPAQVLLFAADQTPFEVPAVVAPKLRSLSSTDNVIAYDAASGTNRTLLAPDGANIIPGARTGSAFRSAHSLIVLRSGGVRMHPHASRGLAPELMATHAMSPGYDQDDPPDGGPGFSEILPMGSIGPDGPHADDEFIELSLTRNLCLTGGFDLEINQGGKLRVFRFPPPCTDGGMIAVFRGNPACFATGPATNVIPQISLPNAAAAYTIRTGSSVLDAVTIDSLMYSAMNAGSVRRSLALDRGAWVVSSQGTSGGCSFMTFASPGALEVSQ